MRYVEQQSISSRSNEMPSAPILVLLPRGEKADHVLCDALCSDILQDRDRLRGPTDTNHSGDPVNYLIRNHQIVGKLRRKKENRIRVTGRLS